MDRNRLQFLDALRGVAVLLVVLSHFGEGHSEFLRDLISSTFQFGQAGVSLFFLISGHIIPRSINGASSLGVFWGHRIMRLYPIYWVSIAVAVLMSAAGVFDLPKGAGSVDVLVNLTMLQGFVGVSNLIGVFWSLKFEMAFYALMTIFVFLGWNRWPSRIYAAWTTCILVIALASVLTPRLFPYGLFHVELMLLGWLLGEWHSGKGSVDSKTAFLGVLAGLVVATLCAYATFGVRIAAGVKGWPTFLPMVTAWISAMVVFMAALIFSNRMRAPGWLARIGVISYSIYLLHCLALPLLAWLAGKVDWMLAAVVCLFITVVVSEMTYRFVEKPAIDFGRKLLARRTESTVQVTPHAR